VARAAPRRPARESGVTPEVYRHGMLSTSTHHPDVLELLSRLVARTHMVEHESRLATEREARDAVDRADELYRWAKDRVNPSIP